MKKDLVDRTIEVLQGVLYLDGTENATQTDMLIARHHAMNFIKANREAFAKFIGEMPAEEADPMRKVRLCAAYVRAKVSKTVHVRVLDYHRLEVYYNEYDNPGEWYNNRMSGDRFTDANGFMLREPVEGVDSTDEIFVYHHPYSSQW